MDIETCMVEYKVLHTKLTMFTSAQSVLIVKLVPYACEDVTAATAVVMMSTGNCVKLTNILFLSVCVSIFTGEQRLKHHEMMLFDTPTNLGTTFLALPVGLIFSPRDGCLVNIYQDQSKGVGQKLLDIAGRSSDNCYFAQL